MNETRQEWFVEERTRRLAMIHLTRRDDLAVTRAEAGTGLQLLASITKAKGEPSLRQFGIVLRGSRAAATEAGLDRTLRPALRSLVRAGEYPYPACLFHFGMDDDQGHYTWVAEPAVADGGPRLLMHEDPRFQKLDRAALDEIVTRVDAWYDAFFARVAVKAS